MFEIMFITTVVGFVFMSSFEIIRLMVKNNFYLVTNIVISMTYVILSYSIISYLLTGYIEFIT